MAAADRGGLLALRAPLLANNAVNITSSATITGAREKSIEAYRRFDLDAIAQAGSFSGIATDGSGTIVLDPGAVVADKANLLADIADGTIPDFVRNFSLAVSPGTGLDGYRIRPGAELASSADIRLVANWNLGAGQIVNLDGTPGFADALAEGLLVESPLGPYTDGPLAGQMRYEVIAGKERELFEHVMADGTTVSFVDMLYRVGGTVRGEAPVLSMRSAGNLDIRSSISDGFFVFHDLTNPDYIDYQLGGGDRTYQPSFSIACGAFDAIACADSRQFSDLKPGALLGSAADRIIIQFGTAQQGAESSPFFINAPYNPLANAASAGGTGDPLGVGELFPLLADDSPVHSTSLRMIGGAALDSANPLQIDVARTGSVIVSGETTYQIIATRGTARLGGALQLSRPIIGENGRTFYDLDELLAIIDGGADDEFQAGYLTTLTWGNGAVGVAARAAALDYAGFQTSGRFIGSAGRRTGVSAPLRVAIAFLRDSGFAETYSQGLAESPPLFPVTPNLLTSVVRLKQNHVYVGTKVRTGDGSIDVAAAADIDLRRTTNIVSRTFLKPGEALQPAAQIGGTALYTAGMRVASADLPGGVLPDAPRNILMSIPGPTSGVVMAPVIARNGGSISLTAGQDVLGRRDVWGELYGQLGTELQNTEVPFTVGKRGYPGTTISPRIISNFGSSTSDQAWRYGFVTQTNTLAAIAPNFFTSGVGALSGGDVAIRAGRDVTDLTVALNNSMATGKVEGVQTLVPFSSGDLSLITGRNLNAGQFDIASGVAKLAVGGNLQDAGSIATTAAFVPGSKSALNLARIRVSDATFSLVARGSVTIGALGGLAPNGTQTTAGDRDNPGFVSSIAGVSAAGSGTVTIANDRPSMFNQALSFTLNTVYAPSLALTALNGDIVFNPQPLIALPMLLYPSRYGQLSLLAGGDISNFAMAMSDAAPINFFGSETFANIGGELQGATVFPLFLSDTADTYRRLQHNRHLTHLGDTEAVRIFAGGSIEQVVLTLPKQARIHASGNITDLIFQGQNVSASDITRISAGGDITGTTSVITGTLAGRNVVLGNSIALGGPGALVVEAGRNLGPFVTSAIGGSRTEAGGIRTIGNEANPWLPARGADLSVLFGVGRGAKFDALQSTYLDPAHLAQLDGDLFEQTEDDFGNKSPDRTRYSYAPVLAEWLRVNQPELFASVFGASPPTGDALKELAYARYGDLYRAFAGVRDPLARNRFLIDKLYFRELAAPSDPSSESFNQYIRGYRAVQTLFPASLGYTDNLATYTTDPATVNADHPLGVPVKKLVDGQPAVADKVATGNVDLRLSTFETARGGDITILGPGGNFIAGSVVRTEAQVSRRATLLPVSNAITTSGGQGGGGSDNLFQGDLRILDTDYNRIFGIPQGFEGILTLRGGEIRGFTDGNFVLNQSRLFTQRGGDITLWSSNGDLNAGQGSRNASSFPPIVLRFSPDGTAEVDSAGSVSGAGIGAFRPSLDVLPSSVRLIAPVGTVDAGDAGVRASGDIFVAAARVANADNFAAGGSISGVPSLAGPAAPAVPSSAAAAVAANALRANKATGGNANQGSRIFVDVLGHFSGSGTTCEEGQHPDIDGQCVPD